MNQFEQLSDEELRRALEAEEERDPWVLDWPINHPGRQVREEIWRRKTKEQP